MAKQQLAKERTADEANARIAELEAQIASAKAAAKGGGEYPKALYHKSFTVADLQSAEPASVKVVQNAEQHAKYDPSEWAESPAEWGVETAPAKKE